MTPSTTNTAARELLTDAERGVIETLLNAVYAAWNLADNTEDAGDITSVTVERGHFEDLSERLDALDALPDDQPEYTMAAAAKARWALRRLLDPTLTQQQGGEQEAGDVEQEARELLAREYDKADPEWAEALRNGTGHPNGTPAFRAVVAALRTKQPAASEGDVGYYCPKCNGSGEAPGLEYPSADPQDAYETMMACGQCEGTGMLSNAAVAANTSKQAAGEAVEASEGDVVFHTAGNVGFKKTLEKDDVPKTLAERKAA